MQEVILVRDLAVVLLVATAAGYVVQRFGFSAVVGYLIAGMVIGPFSPVKLVGDPAHVQLLAQIGLIFLMFSVGLGLSVARLKRMGFSVIVAVGISSVLLLNLCRLFGFGMGWDKIQILFLAGAVMISSSSIVIKALDELNLMHQRAGQLALGITVLEDIVAVVMLTFFVSLLKIGGQTGQATSIWSTLGEVSAFVVLLFVVALLIVPRILKALGRDANPEPRVIAMTGLVLLTAISALQAGYSLALGAFVLGLVVAGTRAKDEIERAFEPLHTIFGAVFFVAVGMIFDYRLLSEVWWQVIIVTILTLVGRPAACAFGLVAAGHGSREALKAGLALIPIGEFTFVLMQVGKDSKALPENFYALGIGVSLTTAILGPLVTRRSEAICNRLEALESRRFRGFIEWHHQLLESFKTRTNASVLWRLCSKRLIHAAVHLLLASALILFSRPVYEAAFAAIHGGWLLPVGFRLVYWTIFASILIGPLIAVWRNMEALAMIIAEGATRGAFPQKIFQTALKALAAFVLFSWFLMLVPRGRWIYWILAVGVTIVIIWAPLFWRRILVLHSKLEVEIREKVKNASTLGAASGIPLSLLERPQEWNLQIDEVVLPLRTEHAGRRIADLGIRKNFGCTIMSIDRQAYLLHNPTANERLFSGDKLLLLGTPEQLAKAEQFLRASGGPRPFTDIENITMEVAEMPENSCSAAQSLGRLDLVGRFAVQVCVIARGSQLIRVPGAEELILPGDKLLLLGSHESIQAVRVQFASQEFTL